MCVCVCARACVCVSGFALTGNHRFWAGWEKGKPVVFFRTGHTDQFCLGRTDFILLHYYTKMKEWEIDLKREWKCSPARGVSKIAPFWCTASANRALPKIGCISTSLPQTHCVRMILYSEFGLGSARKLQVAKWLSDRRPCFLLCGVREIGQRMQIFAIIPRLLWRHLVLW